jgi:ABC-type sugar transport system permease subunit
MFTFLIVLLTLFVGAVILAISISFINHRLNSCGAIKISFEDFKRIFNKNKIYLKPYGNNYLNFILDIPSLTKNYKNSGLYSGDMKLYNGEIIFKDISYKLSLIGFIQMYFFMKDNLYHIELDVNSEQKFKPKNRVERALLKTSEKYPNQHIYLEYEYDYDDMVKFTKLIINKEAISNDEHMAFTNTFNTIYKNEPLD